VDINSVKAYIKTPYFSFILKFCILLFLWFFFYHFIYKIDELIFSSESADKIDILNNFSVMLAEQANHLLSIFGFKTHIDIHLDMVVAKIIDNNYSHGVWIGEPCNGVKVFGVFAIFIIAFPGRIRHKLWYVPFGIICIHIINILRIALLIFISSVKPSILDFNHNITFQIIVYALILLLWYIWVKKFSRLKINKLDV
jgi:exosortase family protein XrtF